MRRCLHLVWLLSMCMPCAAAGQTGPSHTPLASRVVEELRARPIGNHTLDVLNQPDEYLHRVADRMIRSAFETQFRIVVRESKDGIPLRNSTAEPSGTTQPSDIRRSPAVSYLPIWIAVAIIVISGILLARRGKGGA
ncbi:hypothetical protein B7486_17320 [cyanobacterium TDX16]|nr:hypothetical protein B7486_17320 [cyanobacterium TDX16]